MPPQEQKANKLLAVLSFFIPIVGIILYFVEKKDKPKTAKACGKAALASIIIAIVIDIIYFVALGFLSAKMADDPNSAAIIDEIGDYFGYDFDDDYDDGKYTPNPNLSELENDAAADAVYYLDIYAFSRIGLIDQLQYDGYALEVATKAVDSLDVNWNEQAVEMAEEYMDIQTFDSREDLIDQLLYEDFTQEEAEYAADRLGY